jgi:general secretion pathway protein A
LREQPFGVTPDPRYLYPSPTHREALASLSYGVEAGRGFIALIAKPGMGKTTLLFHLLKGLQHKARTVFLFQTQCNTTDLFRYLLADLGVDARDLDLVKMQEQIAQILIQEAQIKRPFVLVIDEAQNLTKDVLESVRLLSDFETTNAKLMQIVLAGQPQLADTLALPDLIQLRQRISILCKIDPLAPEQVIQYIDYRLRVAGYQGRGLFERAALDLLIGGSEGIPRKINNLCFNALSLSYAVQKKTISSSIVQEVLSDLELDSSQFERPAGRMALKVGPAGSTKEPAWAVWLGSWRVRAATFACLLVLLGMLSILLHGRHDIPGDSAQAVSPTNQQTVDQGTTVTVGPNETLGLIVRRHFGRLDPELVQEILRLNPDLRDPNRIAVGQQIRLPFLPDRPKLRVGSGHSEERAEPNSSH